MNLIRITKLIVHQYQAIYTESMNFFPYYTKILQYKISPIVLFEQIAKDLSCQYHMVYRVFIHHLSIVNFSSYFESVKF